MGLLDRESQNQPQPNTGMPEQANQAPSQQAPKDQQEIYERLATMALNFVYSDAGADMVAEGLKLEQADIVQNAGNVVSKIIMRLIITVRSAGQSIPPKMMIQIGMEVAVAVLELAQEDAELPNAEAGVLDAVFYAAITIVGRELPKDILSPQERQEVSQTLQEVQQMVGGNQTQPQQVQHQQPNQEIA